MATTKKRGGKRRAYHHGDLRRALLDEALRLIAERGHLDFTVRELTTAAGVSHTAGYRHFADKRALMTALAVDAVTTMGKAIGAALAAARPSRRARFLAAGRAYVDFALANRAGFQAMFSPEIDAAAPSMLAAKEGCFGLLLAFIDEGQRAGELPKGDAYALAMTVFAMHHGLAVLAIAGAFDKPGMKVATIVDEAHGRLFDGIVAERGVRPVARARPRTRE